MSQTIAACLIVKDEEEFLPECLQSIRELCFEIIVCVDDRTTDRTAEIAESFGATVSEFTWTDDFSAARNAALELVTADWVLVIDADERMNDQGCHNLYTLINKDEHDTIWLLVMSQTKVGMSRNWSLRAWRRGCVHYEGLVHNQPIPQEGSREARAAIHIKHLGYGLPPEQQHVKTQRTIDLLLKQVEGEPDNMFAKSNLVRTYRTIEAWDELLEVAGEILLMPEKDYMENAWIMSMIDMMYAYIQTKQIDNASMLGIEILEKIPNNIDTLMYMGHVYIEQKNWEGALDWYRQYIDCADQEKQTPSVSNLTLDTLGSIHRAYNNMGAAYMELGQPEKASPCFRRSVNMQPDIEIYKYNWIASLRKVEIGMLAASGALRILFIQPAPCARNIKQARALQQAGHRVTLAYQFATAKRYGMDDDMYHDLIRLPQKVNIEVYGEYLSQIASDFDLCVIHNEPDVFTLIAAAAIGGEIPIVHETHDLISLRGQQAYATKFFERFAHHYADGLIFVSDYQRKQAQDMYGRLDVPTMVLWSAIAEENIPKERLPKLSEQDGEIHLVYEGGVGTYGYRDYRSIFSDIANAGIHVHIHSVSEEEVYANMAAGNNYLHYYDPIPPKELMIKLTQYDAGLITLAVDDTNRECANASMPNKLFEYLAAGLPIISRRLTALTEFIEKRQCGMTYEEASEIIALKDGWTLPEIDMPPITMESQIERLVEFYRSLQGHPSTYGIHSFDHEEG